MIKNEVSTVCGLARQSVCTSVTRGMGTVQSPNPWRTRECAICSWKHFLSKLHTGKHTHSADEMLFWRAPPQQRWHKPLSSYLWPSSPYNTHSHTHRLQATDSLPPSLFKAWFLFIKSVSSPSPISTFLLCWILLFVSNPIPPSLLASVSLLFFASLSSFHYPRSCFFSPLLILSLSLLTPLPFYLPSFLNILHLLKSSLRSFSVLYSLLALQLCSPLARPFLLHSGCWGFWRLLAPSGTSSKRKGRKTTCGIETGGKQERNKGATERLNVERKQG